MKAVKGPVGRIFLIAGGDRATNPCRDITGPLPVPLEEL